MHDKKKINIPRIQQKKKISFITPESSSRQDKNYPKFTKPGFYPTESSGPTRSQVLLKLE